MRRAWWEKCTFVVDLVWISKVTFLTPRSQTMSDTHSEKIICVRSFQFADSEKFKCINYSVLVLNLCFIKKAPANSSSVVLMRWIMRYSKVTNRLTSFTKETVTLHQLNSFDRETGVSGDGSYTRRYDVNYWVRVSSSCNENLMRCRQQSFTMESPSANQTPLFSDRFHSQVAHWTRQLSIIKSAGWPWHSLSDGWLRPMWWIIWNQTPYS